MVIERTDDELIKTCQLMNRLGITFSFWGGGRDIPMQVIITANHLYDVLTTPPKRSICDLIENELAENWPVESFEKCLFAGVGKEKFEKAAKLFTELAIPFESIMHYPSGIIDQGSVSAYDLYDIFQDKAKLRVLVSKLRNKAFW